MEAATLTDFQLARAAAAGDQAAFETLYRRHYRRVYSICLRMLRNQTEAEDATQDVFVQVYRKISTFHGDSAFTTWLYSLVVNTVLMYLRNKRRKYREQPTDDEALQGLAPHRALWHQHEIPLIDRLALEQAIARLPAGYRTVFVLHDVEGFGHEEISQILGISAGTSKSQLHKARIRLRELLLAKRRVTHTKTYAY
ncbi:MAG: sigma-70 family RNA polymerase sigma factor [Acidobacteria bacterium]|nr:sigma-70 family RNA polymerase sigma factor [Acidobacteriota bacterium]